MLHDITNNQLLRTPQYCGDINATGQRHGFGTLTYPDGSSFKGTWSEGLPEGHGELTRRRGDGSLGYVGEWHRGKRHGYGTQRWADGAEYIGEWRSDHMDGHGKHSYGSGAVYEGEWKGGVRHGVGLYWAPGDPHAVESRWIDNKRVL